MSKTVDAYILQNKHWEEELVYLCKLLKSTELTETVKWGAPVYTIDGKNVVGLGAFKSYFGLWFYQGVFLKDEQNVLVNASEGVTMGMRQWRFHGFEDIDEKQVMKYVKEAITNQKAGKMIKPQKRELVIPPELDAALEADGVLKTQFNTFTEYKKKEFCNYIAEAKQATTKATRLAKIKPMIMEGVGMNDRYR